ncbi:MAG: DUF2812 domain-containing protein [Eubacteriales bacterium]
MARKVIKILPDRILFTDKIECWLHDMAKEGLILKKMRSHYAVFEESAEEEIYYRIVAYEEDYFTNEIKNMYEAEGWYIAVDQVSRFPFGSIKEEFDLKIFKSESGDDPSDKLFAMHDKTLINEKRKKEEKKHKEYIIFPIFLFAFSPIFLFFIPSMLFFGIGMSTGGISLLFMLFTRQYENNSKKDLEEKMDDFFFSRKEYWEQCQKRNRVSLISEILVTVIILTFNLGFGFINLIFLEERDMSRVPNFISFADIQQIETDYNNTVYGGYIPTPFVPIYYNADQCFKIDEVNDLSSYAYYEIEYSKSIIPYITFIAMDTRERIRFKDKENEICYASSDYFDEITYIEFFTDDKNHVEICMANMSEAIFLSYSGDKTAEEIIKAVENTLYE